MAQNRVLDRVRLEYAPPLGLDAGNLGTQAPSDLDLEMPETPKDRHQQLVSGRERRGETGFDARPGSAVYQEGPMVAGAEYLPVEGHDLVHVAHELRVELTLQGDRHGSQHARMDVDGSRPHQQTRLGIELAKQLRGWGGICSWLLAVARCVQDHTLPRGGTRAAVQED